MQGGGGMHAVWSIRVWSTRVKISPVLKIFGKIRVFSRSKYWTVLAQESVQYGNTQHNTFDTLFQLSNLDCKKYNSIKKTWPVFEQEKKFVRHTAQSEICLSYGIVLFHCSIFAFSSIRFDQGEEMKQETGTVWELMTPYHKGWAKGHQYWKFWKF